MFKQDEYDKNLTTIPFRAYDQSGISYPFLAKKDIRLTENGIEVKNYSLKGQNSSDGKEVDIVFTLDITGSMDEEINAVKAAIRRFVGQLAGRNVKARLCVVSFKDEIFDRCSKFVEDDPTTPKNENLDWFEDFLARLNPSGGGNPRENSLGGVLEASKGTAWGANNQRVIILITDAYFWFLPNHKNEPEAKYAPYYDDVLTSLKSSGALVFPITPTMGGYSKDFFSKPAGYGVNGGEWFDLRKLEKGTLTMDGIFNDISSYIVTDYAVEYLSEDNPGLNPHESLANRKIELAPSSAVISKFDVGTPQSNWPNGQPLPKKDFPLQPGAKPNTEQVTVNGVRTTTGYVIANDTLVFKTAPAPGSEIRIQYERLKLRDHVQTRSLFLSGKGKLTNLKVYLNSSWVPTNHYQITTTTQGGYVLDLTDQAFPESDPYNVRSKGYLDIAVEYFSEK
jgi:hypothetical protein